MKTITLKDHPELLAVIRKVNPSYRKHKAIIREANSFTNYGSYWDGGSRSIHYLVSNGKVSLVPGPTAPPQFNGGSPVTIELVKGEYVVTLGTFCGKPATASITIGG